MHSVYISLHREGIGLSLTSTHTRTHTHTYTHINAHTCSPTTAVLPHIAGIASAAVVSPVNKRACKYYLHFFSKSAVTHSTTLFTNRKKVLRSSCGQCKAGRIFIPASFAKEPDVWARNTQNTVTYIQNMEPNHEKKKKNWITILLAPTKNLWTQNPSDRMRNLHDIMSWFVSGYCFSLKTATVCLSLNDSFHKNKWHRVQKAKNSFIIDKIIQLPE